MKITHYNNSFISVTSHDEQIVCDPWVGKANSGGWQSFPEFPLDGLTRHLANARWIYLSHLHDDHFNPNTLKELNLLDRCFLIKRYQTPVMRNRLRNLGVERVQELDSFSINKIGPFQIAIFPQMTSTSSSLADDVRYDLDTSVAIRSDETVFFNQVDNPFSMEDLAHVRNWILQHMGKIDIACIMSGAASEYPQLFLGIDKFNEKKQIVNSSLEKLVSWLRLLDPTYYFPAGGSYVIPGRLSYCNSLIAQPSFKQIDKKIKRTEIRTTPIDLEGGYSIDIFKHRIDIPKRLDIKPIFKNRKASIKNHCDDPYDYEMLAYPSFSKTIETLELARENWAHKIAAKSLMITQSIRFEIYRDFSTFDETPDQTRHLGSFQLFQSSNHESGTLAIHIDQRALYGCLTRHFVWNCVLGSLCLFDRRPNHHFPTDFFSLNYLVI